MIVVNYESKDSGKSEIVQINIELSDNISGQSTNCVSFVNFETESNRCSIITSE